MTKLDLKHQTPNDAKPLLCAVNLKEELIRYLKTKHISDVHNLWGETKSYYKNRLIEMGGSYASFGNHISVKLSINGNTYSFNVSLSEFV